MVESLHSQSSKERNVYNFTSAIDIKDYKISAIDVHDNVLIIGSEKGYVYPYEITISNQDKKKCIYDPMNEGGKRGNSKIDQIKYLPRSSMIAVLLSNQITIIQSNDLRTIQTFTKKVHMFCLNNAVYKPQSASGQTVTVDQICVATTDKFLFFFELTTTSGQFKFEEEKKNDKGLFIGSNPLQLYWDDTLIYIASKKAYVIMQKDTAAVLQSIPHDKLSTPILSLSKTRCLILANSSEAVFFDETGIKKQIVFRIDPSKQLINIVMQEMYVIIVYESSIAIYNATNGDFLEEKGKLDAKQKYKSAVVNFAGTELYVYSHHSSSGKNMTQSEIYQLMEVPAQDQIDFLLCLGRIQEAKEVFLTKETKGAAQFNNRLKQFNLDAGWVYLNEKLDFDNAVNNFKSTDVDPREFILLFKELYDSSTRLDGLKSKPVYFMPKIIENVQQNSSHKFNPMDKLNQAKRAVTMILEVINAKYAGEIKKDVEKEISYTYSKFSMPANCLYQDRKVSLREMLCLVQTNLLKLYVDMREKDQIYKFFKQFAKQIYLDSRELETYLSRNKDDPISQVTLALVYENIDDYDKALKIWSDLIIKNINQTEGCERTVSILRRKKDIEQTKKYGKWVLQNNPQIGLTLFTVDPKTGEQPVEMKPDEVLEYLEGIEKDNPSKDGGFPYVEAYLEYIIKNADVPDRFYTLLASLYIDKLFKQIPPKIASVSKDLAQNQQVSKYRDKLQTFLDTKTQYNAQTLLEKISNTWMFDEEVLLLIKQDRHNEALEKYVVKGDFVKALDFCLSKDKSPSLLTSLLEIYFSYYEKYINMFKNGEGAKYKTQAEKYCQEALKLMTHEKSKDTLNPKTVINKIPEDWDIITDQYNLISLLTSLFDHQLTIEENSKISKNLSLMEQLNAEHELNELKSAYLVIGEESMCKVCRRELKADKIRVYPNGSVFHQRCAKDPNECPITRQRFDNEISFINAGRTSSPPSSYAPQYRRPPKSGNKRQYDPNAPLLERMNLKQSLPYLIMILALKEAFSHCSMIQVFEYQFVLGTIFIFTVLPYVQLYRKEFILNIDNKDAGLNCAQWMTLFVIIELVTLKSLPLLSKIQIIAFFVMEFEFNFGNNLGSNSQHHMLRQGSNSNTQNRLFANFPNYCRKNYDEQSKKQLTIHSIIIIVCLIYDAYIIGVFNQSISTQLNYLLMILIQIVNTVFIYQYKLKKYFKTGQLDKDTELLKVKWISSLLLSFISPLFVFIFNTTPNYSILRFNKDIWIFVLILIAIGLQFYWNVMMGGGSNMSNNKPLLIGLAAAAALVGGAVLFHLISGKQGATSSTAVLEDIDALGPPKKESNGLLSFAYFKDIMQIVQKHGKERFARDKQDFLVRRRQLLQQNRMDEYKEVVSEMVKKEEQNFQDLMMEVVEHIGLTEQEFMQVNQIYMSNPQTSQVIMQGQLMPGTSNSQEPPKLTRQRTKEIFLYSEEKKMDQMKNMMESGKFGGMGMGGGGNDPFEGMMEMMVEQCKLSDEIYFKFGVDDDEFNFAMVRHNLMNDPEIQRTLMMNMQKLGINPAMMGGGMGGY